MDISGWDDALALVLGGVCLTAVYVWLITRRGAPTPEDEAEEYQVRRRRRKRRSRHSE